MLQSLPDNVRIIRLQVSFIPVLPLPLPLTHESDYLYIFCYHYLLSTFEILDDGTTLLCLAHLFQVCLQFFVKTFSPLLDNESSILASCKPAQCGSASDRDQDVLCHKSRPGRELSMIFCPFVPHPFIVQSHVLSFHFDYEAAKYLVMSHRSMMIHRLIMLFEI